MDILIYWFVCPGGLTSRYFQNPGIFRSRRIGTWGWIPRDILWQFEEAVHCRRKCVSSWVWGRCRRRLRWGEGRLMHIGRKISYNIMHGNMNEIIYNKRGCINYLCSGRRKKGGRRGVRLISRGWFSQDRRVFSEQQTPWYVDASHVVPWWDGTLGPVYQFEFVKYCFDAVGLTIEADLHRTNVGVSTCGTSLWQEVSILVSFLVCMHFCTVFLLCFACVIWRSRRRFSMCPVADRRCTSLETRFSGGFISEVRRGLYITFMIWSHRWYNTWHDDAFYSLFMQREERRGGEVSKTNISYLRNWEEGVASETDVRVSGLRAAPTCGSCPGGVAGNPFLRRIHL